MGRCAWLGESCVEAIHGQGGAEYARFLEQVEVCPFTYGLGKCPAGECLADTATSQHLQFAWPHPLTLPPAVCTVVAQLSQRCASDSLHACVRA